MWTRRLILASARRRSVPCVPWRHLSGAPSISSKPEKEEEEKKPEQKKPASLLPGLGVSAATAATGFTLADVLTQASGVPIAGIPVSILLGVGLRNSFGASTSLQPGLTTATKPVLQAGIVAVAAKLSCYELLTTGSSSLPVAAAAIASGLVFFPIAGRLAGLPKDVTALLTAGTSICGVTAITALAPAIQASNRSTAIAVANTVAFGTLGMLAYPYLFHAIAPQQAGLCLGVAIHDTSQVLGASLAYQQTFGDATVVQTAAVTKLTRNLGLAVVIPYLSVQNAKTVEDDKKPETTSGLVTFQKAVPPFLWAFLGVSVARSIGDSVLVDDSLQLWQTALNLIGKDCSQVLLGTAMAGVGWSTSLESLRGVGWKPFAVGGTGAMVVGTTGYLVASMVG